jgi:hypothetical protein
MKYLTWWVPRFLGYIFDPQTLQEIKRVLVPAGKLVILLMAWITGRHPLEWLAAPG